MPRSRSQALLLAVALAGCSVEIAPFPIADGGQPGSPDATIAPGADASSTPADAATVWPDASLAGSDAGSPAGDDAAVQAPDSSVPVDAGSTGTDAASGADAAATGADAAAPGADAASAGRDAAAPGLDAAAPGSDAAAPGSDAAAPGPDAAAPGPDAAAPGADAAAPGPDASSPGLDAGPRDASAALTTSVTTVTVGAGTIAASIDYEYGPFLAMLPDGRAKLAWCDSSARKVYVRHLDASLSTAERADTVLDGGKLFGLVAHADGRCAVLTVTPAPGACTPCTVSSACVSCDLLHLVQLSDQGAIAQQKVIDDRLNHSGMYSGGAIALGTHSSAEAYAVARTVRGAGPTASDSATCVSPAGNCGHQWHETWVYKTSDLSTLASGCNVFPCGHSLFKRSVAAHPSQAGFGSTCVSDYTGTRTGFNYALNNGWNTRLYNVWQDWPNFVNGGTPSELVPANARTYLTALSAPQSCASTCAGDAHDVAVMEVSLDTKTVTGGVHWVATGAGWQKYPHLARYGASYLLGWTSSDSTTSDFGAPTHWWIAEIDSGATVLAGPLELPASASFPYGTNWATDPATGDVVWARRASSTTIDLVRVRR